MSQPQFRVSIVRGRARLVERTGGMNPPIPVEEQLPIATHRETDTPESDELAQCSFTAEESAALLWLRHWYQSGGSDRMESVRHWEFLKWLMMMDKLEA